jgi:TrmH family RNA methyltransferase
MLQPIKPYKKDFDYSYALGVFLTIELLEHKPEHVLSIILSTNAVKNSGLEKIRGIAESHGIPIEINDRLIERLSPKENCYAVGVFRKYDNRLDNGKNHIVLVNPMDSGNLGTIIRTSLGFKFTNMAIIRPAVDIFDPKSIRASMGAVFSMCFSYFDSFEAYSESFSQHQLYPFLLNGQVSIHMVHTIKKEPYALIFGNESSGLPESFNAIGTGITIPHAETIDSLNLSVAAAIAEYEFTKSHHA